MVSVVMVSVVYRVVCTYPDDQFHFQLKYQRLHHYYSDFGSDCVLMLLLNEDWFNHLTL